MVLLSSIGKVLMNSFKPALSMIFVVVLTTLLAACQPPAAPAESLHARTARDTSPDAPADDISQLVADNNAFAFDLYHQVASEQDGNLIFSPYSISLAFAMVYAGARGDTEQQMAEVLHYSLPQERLHPAFNTLDLKLQPVEPPPPTPTPYPYSNPPDPLVLNIASTVWGQHGFPFEADYLEILALNYGAGLQSVDFAADSEGARRSINQWVSDATEDRIEEIAAPGTIDSETKVVLANAIYFNGEWDYPFTENETHSAPFRRLDGSEVDATMMVNNFTVLKCGRGATFHAVELGYGGPAAMLLLLPDEGAFPAFESALNASIFHEVSTTLQPTNSLTLTMPRYDFEAELDLVQSLKGMGLTAPFSNADFSGISSGGLVIDAAVHKATIAVDEQGTEATGATMIAMTTSLMASACGQDVVAVRPFIFTIYDTDSGTILFLGRVLDPSQ
jgi:serpin B